MDDQGRRNENSKHQMEATEDDEFGEFEGPEDDAPESVQATSGPGPWAIFPDLLRVQSNSNSSRNEDLDNNMRSRGIQAAARRIDVIASSSSTLSSNNSNNNASIRSIARETGAIPKQRVLDPPDISLLTSHCSSSSQAKPSPAIDLCSSALSYRTPETGIGSGNNICPQVTSRQSNLNQQHQPQIDQTLKNANMNGSGDVMSIPRVAQLERDLKAAQTQKAVLQQQLLQKDTQIRELQSVSRSSLVPNVISSSAQSQELMVTSLTDALDKFRVNMEASIQRIDDRLTSLENQLPRLVSSAVQSGLSCQESLVVQSNDIDGGNDNVSAKSAVIDLKSLLEQHKKQVDQERKDFLLTFSDVLRRTSESLQINCDANGPK